MASGPGQPADPPRPGDSLARHRWVTAAGMTATIAAVAGGGLALAFHDSSPGPAKKCGLVPCAAALPASVRSSGTGLASAPATTTPTARPRASTPSPAAPAPAPPVSAEPVSAPEHSSPSAVASSAGRAVSADHAVGVGYEITADRHGRSVHGQLVIANHGSAPVSGWRVTVVLPGDTGYQVHNAGNRSAGDALVTAAAGRTLAPGSTMIITFTAQGTTSSPRRAAFSERAGRDGAGSGGSGAAGPGTGRAGSQPGSGHDGYGGWLGGWFSRGWAGGGWPSGGWPSGGWPSGGGHGGGWSGGGWTGGGWTGGR